jgi:hypothetical protein
MAVLIGAGEATHDVAMQVNVRMVHRPRDVPVARRTGVRWTDEAGGREIATQVAARARVLVVVPEAGEKATVLTPAVEAVEIHSEIDNRVVRLAVVIANQRWLADAALAARRHSLGRKLVDRVDRHRLPATRDVRHSVADHRSPAHLSSRREWDGHSQAVPDHRRSVVRKVDRLSLDPPGVDPTHVVTVEMDPLKAVADRPPALVMVVAEAHRVAHQTDVEIEAQGQMHETVGVTDRPTAATADRIHVLVMVAAEARRAARQTDGEVEDQDRMHETAVATDRPTAAIADRNQDPVTVGIEAPDRMHEMVAVTGLHPELTDRDDGEQTAIGVTPPVADQMAMLHETVATDAPTEIVDRTHGQTETVDQSLIDPTGKRRDQLT